MNIDTFLAKPWAGAAIATATVLGGVAILDTNTVAGLVLLAFAISMFAGVMRARINTAMLPPAPGKLVSINETRLHIFADGNARDAHPVIWVAGGHGEGLLMRNLHDGIKADTRSILFDRPGSGWSDIGRLPLTVSGEVALLKSMLDASGETGPYVLAGHSFGGMFSVNFAHHYPDLVAGLVLLDPTPPWNVAFAGELSFGPTLRKSRSRALAAHFGLGLYIEPEIDEEDSDYYRALAAHAKMINAHSVEAKSLLAEASIFRSAMANPMDLVISSGALGDMPLLLIAANEGEDALEATRLSLKDQLGLTDLQVENLMDGLNDANEQQARLSTNGRLIYAPEGASHMFLYEHPDFVLTEVRKMARIPSNVTV